MSKSTLKDRLRAAMDGPTRVTAADLARAVGVSAPSVSDWLSGKSQSLRGENLTRAARKLGVNTAWLGLGEGPMRSGEPAPAPDSQEAPTIQALDPRLVREAHEALRFHGKRCGKPFNIESEEGAAAFIHCYGVLVRGATTEVLSYVIENLDSMRPR